MRLPRIIPSLVLLAAAAAAAMGAAPARAAEAGDADAARRAAVAKGLAALAAGLPQAIADDQGNRVAFASLAGLAFLQSGSLPGRGPYAAQVERCLGAVLAARDADTGLLSARVHGPMYSHGFATLFLAELYARAAADDAATRERVRPPLEAAVRLIERAQNATGGWRYFPNATDADVSVSALQLNALVAARGTAVAVPDEVVRKAVAYVWSCQNEADGGFLYMSVREVGGMAGSGWPRTAAAAAALQHAGEPPDRKELRRALDFLRGRGVTAFEKNEMTQYAFYFALYAAQALHAAGGDDWQKSYPPLRDALVGRQRDDGTWEGDLSPQYATAAALISLQMPDGGLMAFAPKRRDEPGAGRAP